jgi:PAS domain S-box-containing protein
MTLWQNFVWSGIVTKDEKLQRRLVFFNTFSFLAILVLVVFGSIQLFNHNLVLGWAELMCGMFLLANVWWMRLLRHTTFSINFLLGGVSAALLLMLMTGGIEGTGVYWYFTFPVSAFFLTGKNGGIKWISFVVLMTIAAFILHLNQLIPFAYAFIEVRQLVLSLLVVSTLVYLYQDTTSKGELQIKQSEHQFQEYLDNMSIFTAKIDTQGKILFANKAARVNFGLGDELIGKPFFGPWWEFDSSVSQRVNDKFQRVLQGEKLTYNEQVQIMTDKGPQVITIKLSLVPIFKDNKVDHLIAEGTDISQMIALQKTLQEESENLGKMNSVMVDRELRMRELKQQNEKLQKKLAEKSS